MTSKRSYFSPVISIITENFRRFWLLSLMGFLGYFLSGPFIILMRYKNPFTLYYFISSCMTNENYIFAGLNMALPIISGILVFHYLQTSASATMIHSLPISRSQLFIGQILSGYLMAALPALLNGAVFHIISRPTYDRYMYVDPWKMTKLATYAKDCFSRSEINSWLIETLIFIGLVFSISVIAGIISGNTIMHISLALGLNFLLPAVYFVFLKYSGTYLFGFTQDGLANRILSLLIPIAWGHNGEGHFPQKVLLSYSLVSLVVLIIAFLIYRRRKQETIGDNLVFPWTTHLLNYVIAYFGMFGVSIYFVNNFFLYDEDSKTQLIPELYAGALMGSIVFFLIGRIILKKTPHVFNLTTLKSGIVYLCIAFLFLNCIVYDWTGFEKRIPAEDSIYKAYASVFNYENTWSRYDRENFKVKEPDKLTPAEYGFNSVSFKSEEALAALRGLHQDVIEYHEKYGDKEMPYYTTNLTLDYRLKGKLPLQRSYNMPYSFYMNNKHLKALYESREFKEMYSFKNLKVKNITAVQFSSSFMPENRFLSTFWSVDNKDDVAELLSLMEADFQDRTFEDFSSLLFPYCNVSLVYSVRDKDTGEITKSNIECRVLRTDKRTIEWIENHNLADIVGRHEQQIAYIYLDKYDYRPTEDGNNSTDYERVYLYDPDEIRQVLDSCQCSQMSSNLYYDGCICYVKEDFSSDYLESNYIYFDGNSIPDFLKGRFKKISN